MGSARQPAIGVAVGVDAGEVADAKNAEERGVVEGDIGGVRSVAEEGIVMAEAAFVGFE